MAKSWYWDHLSSGEKLIVFVLAKERDCIARQ